MENLWMVMYSWIKLVFPDKPFALIFDLFSCLGDNLYWNSCIRMYVVMRLATDNQTRTQVWKPLVFGILYFVVRSPAVRQGHEKLVYRLILLFSSTEIFSKRRKIYSWYEGKPELVAGSVKNFSICTANTCLLLVVRGNNTAHAHCKLYCCG